MKDYLHGKLAWNTFNCESFRDYLTNLDLTEYAHRLGIKYFRGVLMRDALPKKPRHQECGIVNFNTSQLGVTGYDIIKMASGEYTLILSDK